MGASAITCGAFILSNTEQHSFASKTTSIYILGPARKLLAQSLYGRAGTYFHKGAPRKREEAFTSIFQKWKREISPALHVHAQGSEIEETLPWLRLATQSDPHNLEIYLVTSFWLAGECGRPDLATQVIEEALEKNPGRYELYLEKGRMHLSNFNYKKALNSIEKAQLLIGTHKESDPDQVKFDQPFILAVLSYLYEGLELNAQAEEATRQLLSIKPSPFFYSRLQQLEYGQHNPEKARARLHELFYKEHNCELEIPNDTCSHGCGNDNHDDCVQEEPDPCQHEHGPGCSH